MPGFNVSQSAFATRKAVLFVGACLLVLAFSIRYQKYHSILNQAEQMTLESLENAAWGIAQTIDGDEHQIIQEKYKQRDQITSVEQDSLYRSLHQKLRAAQVQLAFETPIYTYAKTGVEHGMAFIGTSAKTPYFRHEMDSAPEEQVARFGEYMTLPIYTDSHGSWLSACAPIFNAGDEVVAMVQVDRCFDHFIVDAKQQAYAGLWWNVLLILGLVVIVWRYISGLNKKEEKAKLELLQTVREKTHLSERLALREAELEKQKALLIDKNQYLEDFANIASHDLKSPLRGISNFASLLSRQLGTTAESSVTEYIAFIKNNATRALSLVDGILGYSKIGKDAQKNTPNCLHQLASDALDNLKVVVAENNAIVEISPALPNATCDATLITQLFQNLMANGLKYNESAVPTVRVSSHLNDKKQIVFAVTDNGIGIDEKYKEQVFEMFSRLHPVGCYEGSGIGLAFCLRIVNSYGGEMWLESELGHGTTFYFTLPKACSAKKEIVIR